MHDRALAATNSLVSRNCTKHKIRCPYNDMQLPAEERSTTPDKPELMWTAEIEATIDQWQRTGVFPFPGLNIFPTPNVQFLSVEDLRLIHRIAEQARQGEAGDRRAQRAADRDGHAARIAKRERGDSLQHARHLADIDLNGVGVSGSRTPPGGV